MSDQELRELERRARESEDPADEAALLTARLRAGLLEPTLLRARAYLGDPAARLALGPERPTRWDRLAPFVADWFAEPLAPDLDAAWANLVQLEQRCGTFPEAIREWLVLTHGRAGSDVAESAVLAPDFVVVRDERLPVFCDRQGYWSYTIRLEDADVADPPVYLGAEPLELPASEVLWLGLLYGVVEAAAWDLDESSFSPLRAGLDAEMAPMARRPELLWEPAGGPLTPFDPKRSEGIAQEYSLEAPPRLSLSPPFAERAFWPSSTTTPTLGASPTSLASRMRSTRSRQRG